MTLAGVDGCPAGWLAVRVAPRGPLNPEILLVRAFADLLEADILAVDMPVGLPDRLGAAGRGPERLVRPLLGARQSSVFSIPARAAVEAEDYRAACAAALANSDPPRKVSKQAFHLFPKIREIDRLLISDPTLSRRVFEAHPEVGFARLNGGPLETPKKVKGAAHGPGLAQRRALLAAAGFPVGFLDTAPKGAGLDDLLDAAVNALCARRIHEGVAVSHPNPPGVDGRGLPIAIWS